MPICEKRYQLESREAEISISSPSSLSLGFPPCVLVDSSYQLHKPATILVGVSEEINGRGGIGKGTAVSRAFSYAELSCFAASPNPGGKQQLIQQLLAAVHNRLYSRGIQPVHMDAANAGNGTV